MTARGILRRKAVHTVDTLAGTGECVAGSVGRRRWTCAVSLRRLALAAVAPAMALVSMPAASGHEGPDPRCNWLFRGSSLHDGMLVAESGPDLKVAGQPRFTGDGPVRGLLRGLLLDGNETSFAAVGSWPDVVRTLPGKHLTVSAWVGVDELLPYGGIVGAFQDNGDAEKGWVLGYDEQAFTFAVATKGGDDGNGHMTYLRGKTTPEPGRWYHVCGVYDGATMQVWVNGVLEGESRDQQGDILYPDDATLVVGGYVDANESNLLTGRLAQVAIYDLAATGKWIEHEFDHHRSAAQAAPAGLAAGTPQFVVRPYLQFATTDSIRVMCETDRPATVRVRFGETSRFDREVTAASDDRLLHTAVLGGLAAETGHFYQVIVDGPDAPDVARGDVGSFQTASLPATPFAFAVIADTQGNPAVNGALAKLAWGLRPNFLVVPGDLVEDGPVKRQWVEEFFASMSPLFARVPFYPVLGNHERDADHYYRYMDLPAPEYRYAFDYGNARFFMLDSNKKVDPESEQYRWLEEQLAGIRAARARGAPAPVWTFVSYHHPSYSSDEDDYGNLWKGKSTWGDTRIRPLTKLFDDYAVDFVWNGHIHSYERTWPVRDGRVVEDGGTIYMITGGGGGGLEQAGPIRPPFQNNVRRGHHFVFVSVNGHDLELKSYGLEGQLFDTLRVRKARGAVTAP